MAAGRALSEANLSESHAEHVSRLLRLRKTCAAAVVTWPLFTVADWYIATYVEPGRLWYYLVLRAIGLVVLLAGVLGLFSAKLPGPRFLRAAEVGVCTSLSILITLQCVEFRGIASPLITGVILILLCRSAIIADHWRRGIWPIGLIAIAHPATLAIASLAVPKLAAEFHDPAQRAGFVLNLSFLGAATLITLFGGHMVWELRRQVFQARAFGHYRLKRKIGAGGMGEVWVAHHHTLKRDVAVKILRPETRGDANAIARFEREVRATADLSHPNTVRVFDYGLTDDGLWYYVMEYLEGQDLQAIMAARGPLEPALAVRLIGQAARALAEAHARGIVHRDVKPENLFVTQVGGEGDFVKVLDFGLAQLAERDRGPSLTETGYAVGTPRWTSPEVVMGNQADPRSDVYALGAVLYYLLCGKPPFDSLEVQKTLMAHLHDRPTPPSERLGRALPPAIEAVVLRCLAKDPADRFADAGRLADALVAASGEVGVSGSRVSIAAGLSSPTNPQVANPIRAVGSHAFAGQVLESRELEVLDAPTDATRRRTPDVVETTTPRLPRTRRPG